MNMRGTLLFPLLMSILCACSTAHNPNGSSAARVDAVFSHLSRGESPGVALAVVRNGRVVLRRGYGLANLEHRVPITPSTVFDTASLAKPFTALAVATLVCEDRLKLTDDVRKYIPELPETEHPITIGHLVHHTSGVRDWPGLFSIAGWRFEDVITFPQILSMAYRQRTLNFSPGSEHLYSNTGYNLLAEVVQRITAKPFRAWMDERFFRPLGMVGTHVSDTYADVVARRASSYAPLPRGSYRAVTDNLAAPGSSSLFSNVDDLARWMLSISAPPAAGSCSYSMMQNRGRLNDGTTTRYAFGVLMGSYRGLPMFTHSGRWASFNSFIVYFPEQEFGIVALSNSDAVDAQNAVIQVANIYLEKDFEPRTELRSDVTDVAAPPTSDADSAPSDRVQLEDYVGDYDSDELLTTYRLVVVETTLQIRHSRRGAVPLEWVAGDEFRSRDGYLNLISFERDSTGNVAAFTINGDPRNRDIRFIRRRQTAESGKSGAP